MVLDPEGARRSDAAAIGEIATDSYDFRISGIQDTGRHEITGRNERYSKRTKLDKAGIHVDTRTASPPSFSILPRPIDDDDDD